MTIDGRAIAEEVYAALAPRFEGLSVPARLGIVVVGKNPVVDSFVGIKTRAAERLGVVMVRRDIQESASTKEAIQEVENLARECSAVIVQLPLPKHMDTNEVLAAIPPEKDVDAIHPRVPEDERLVHAPVALAVEEILMRGGVNPEGKRAVVVGAGRLVGKPTAALLARRGADVSMFTLEEGSIEDVKGADILVLGAGNPGFIKPEHIRDGVALVDAGASESEGKVVGDADPACAEKAGLFTPVPGGVGPVAVAMIFRNLLAML